MRVYLDDHPCDVAAGSVSQAIAAVAEMVAAAGRMIVEVRVDGALVGAQALSAADQSTPNEIQLTSANTLELVCDTLQDASDALDDADHLQRSAAEHLQADEVPQAMEKLESAIGIWMSVQRAVVLGSEMAGIDLIEAPRQANQSIDNRPRAGTLIEDLTAQLRTMRSALESKDTVALSDTLLYDLPQVVQRWRGLLDDLGRRVRTTERA